EVNFNLTRRDYQSKKTGTESEEDHVTNGDVIIKMHPFVRQTTVTSAFGRQSTFDLLDDEVLLSTDDKKRRKRLTRRGVLILILGSFIVLCAAGGLGTMAYFHKKAWHRVKYGRLAMVLDASPNNNTKITMHLYELSAKDRISEIDQSACQGLKPKHITLCINQTLKDYSDIGPKIPLHVLYRKGANESMMAYFKGNLTNQISPPSFEEVDENKKLIFLWLMIYRNLKSKSFNLFRTTKSSVEYVGETVPSNGTAKDTFTASDGVVLTSFRIPKEDIFNKQRLVLVKSFNTNESNINDPCGEKGSVKYITTTHSWSKNDTTEYNISLLGTEDFETCIESLKTALSIENQDDSSLHDLTKLKDKFLTQSQILISSSNIEQSLESMNNESYSLDYLYNKTAIGCASSVEDKRKQCFGAVVELFFLKNVLKIDSTKNYFKKVTDMPNWTLGWLNEKYHTQNTQTAKRELFSPKTYEKYEKISGTIFTPLAVVFGFILIIGLIFVIIGNAHLP
uniref:Uncharacterized protein n=1 Tax=Clytia hemisphaerica TaxID=252671 RepID=A0A7M5XL76_9CNID